MKIYIFKMALFASTLCYSRSFQCVSKISTVRNHLVLKALKSASRTKSPSCLEIEVDEFSDDLWKLTPVVEILKDGGVGILPTDTCYVFCCDVHSRRGVDKIFQLKQYVGRRKPLSLLCKDISSISKHSDGVDKELFKILKKVLPGPFTFILPANHEVPRVLLEHKKHKKTWKRREVGMR
mmetsp:Transcript_14167/g.20011  ORF Transcript_14167/g.20011 Transcript_14167/m.20011 type:complete len:180 (-) Transcript_14167:407-946(-)